MGSSTLPFPQSHSQAVDLSWRHFGIATRPLHPLSTLAAGQPWDLEPKFNSVFTTYLL